ncbi:MAG: Asp-tRNA(Asn)/Glu-tRNA(Gln) amidotransferase subunit GatA, partial [Myxococcales bacterium]|nr:Asp-tRNA(Asn)/Glu-tRNA(Gln) amidotransferase subunit GatA [Myxococcales bacterium]
GPLAGVPLGLKDIFVTRGLATTCGSRILDGWLPPYDSTHALRLRQAGAVLLGKLAMDELAMGSSGEHTHLPPTCNPWDLGHVPGGSSGGAAAAVAARLVAVGLGSDTGGSIRQPASLCGVVGLKPTYGRVSRRGLIAFASSLDQAGPITRTTRDAARVLTCLAGHDPEDASSLRAPVPDYEAACARGVRGLRVGVLRAALAGPGLDPEVADACARAIEALARAGATLVDVALPHAESAVACYYVVCAAEASSNLARYDGLRYGPRVEAPTLRELYAATRSAGFGAEVKRRIMLGTFVLRSDSYARYYGQAMRVRTLIARDHARVFDACDVIAGPTSPVPAFRRGERLDDPLAMYRADVFTIGANLAGLPAISIPAGFTQATAARPRLPIGLQLVGPPLGEEALLAAAAAHEAATSWHLEAPPEPGGAA